MSTTSGLAVTGASGFLGAHVCASAFARAQAEASLADPLGPPVYGICRTPEDAPRFTSPRDAVFWEIHDLAPPGAAAWILGEIEPHTVIHCAALARPADCDRDPARALRMNAELAGEVALWCAEHGARLVHVSTDLVFGAVDAPEGGFTEDAPPAPVSEYGRTKLRGEELVLEHCPAALVVRLPLLYGNSGGRGLGAGDSLLEAVERDELPPLFVDEWRTPLEVGNAAGALVELAGGDERGLLHVAGPSRVSRYDLGIAILGAMGLDAAEASKLVRPALTGDVELIPPRPRDVSLDASRARGLLETELLGVRAGTRAAVR